MGGAASFLLGSVLGVLLGFLISRRQLERRRSVRPFFQRDGVPASPESATAPTEVAAAPEPAEVAPPVTAPPEAPVALEPSAVLTPSSPPTTPWGVAVAPEPVTPAPEVSVVPEAGPVAAEARPLEVEAVEGVTADREDAGVEAGGIDTVVAGEEKVEHPGIGGPDEEVAETVTRIPEETPSYPGPGGFVREDRQPVAPATTPMEHEAEAVSAEVGFAGLDRAAGPGIEEPREDEPVRDSALADDLRARIEETRRRIRRELEQPFVAADQSETTQRSVEEPPAPRIEQPSAPTIEELLAERPMDQVPVEPPAYRAEAAPAPMVGEPGRPRMEEPPAERIHETLARAVEEAPPRPVEEPPAPRIEQPSAPTIEELLAELPVDQVPVEPSAEGPVDETPVEPPRVDAAPESAPSDAPTASQEGPRPPTPAEVWETGEEPFSKRNRDYDAMRTRIEMTRSRLKAKAFDAMMSGESALLGKDAANAVVTESAPVEVDKDIVETIETGLREEES